MAEENTPDLTFKNFYKAYTAKIPLTFLEYLHAMSLKHVIIIEVYHNHRPQKLLHVLSHL